jgi:hypothetical protein
MRARDMTAKLDRLPIREEIKIPDLSLLSAKDQDRANDLANLVLDSTRTEAERLSAYFEFENLVADLPQLGRNEQRQRPMIAVPRGLAYYWQTRSRPNDPEYRRYNFYELKKVQIVRFVELCEHYGYRQGPTNKIAPLDEWETEDRKELVELLEIAAAPKPRSRRFC